MGGWPVRRWRCLDRLALDTLLTTSSTTPQTLMASRSNCSCTLPLRRFYRHSLLRSSSHSPVLSRLPLLGFIVPWISHYLPESAIRMILQHYPSSNVRAMMDISNTMEQRSTEIIDGKKTALLQGDEELVQKIGEGKDIMSVLRGFASGSFWVSSHHGRSVKDNMTASETEKLTKEELVAQMSYVRAFSMLSAWKSYPTSSRVFILAGMDTTSNALSRILHLLAQNQAEQEKLRAEILEARDSSGSDVDIGEDISYDDLVKLPYLDAVCRETLRLYAPVNIIPRR